MALLERVSTLVRANLNDLIDKAEDPEKMIKQVILDMENQLLQVKTQVAIAIADQHVLDKKLKETEEQEQQWMRRAELSLDKHDDALARTALERSMSYKSMAESFSQQVEDQKTQVENLKSALLKLQQKLTEAKARAETLIAQHRRSRSAARAGHAEQASNGSSATGAFDRMKGKVAQEEATAAAFADLAKDDVDRQFEAIEKQEQIDRLLSELKARRSAR